MKMKEQYELVHHVLGLTHEMLQGTLRGIRSPGLLLAVETHMDSVEDLIRTMESILNNVL